MRCTRQKNRMAGMIAAVAAATVLLAGLTGPRQSNNPQTSASTNTTAATRVA